LESKHILYIVSNVSKAIAFEWIADELSKKGFKISFLILGKSEETGFADYLKVSGIPYKSFSLGGKLSWPSLIYKLYNTIKTFSPDVVHTHLVEASLLGLLAAKLAGVRYRISTRHHSTFHHQYHPRAVLYDKIINRLSTKIIAISPNVKRVLLEREKVDPSKVEMIPHGFDLEEFANVPNDRVELLRKKYHISEDAFVVGSIGRYFSLKGIQYLIKAFIKFKKEVPNAHLCLFNAHGPYKKELHELLKELNQDEYTEVAFENDLFAIYQLFDVYVHVPIDPEIEAFGQTYVESLASSRASIFTLSGIAHEFVIDGYNALVVPYQNADAIYQALNRLHKDNELKSRLTSNAAASVKDYNLQKFINRLEALYLQSDED